MFAMIHINFLMFDFLLQVDCCVLRKVGFEILCFEQLVLRNVLAALNHIQIDNWQLDPSANKYVYCAYILYNYVAINVNASNKKQQYNIKQSSIINLKKK